MRKLFLIGMLVVVTANVAQAMTLVGANFYDAAAACEKGARIGKDDKALAKDGDVFVFKMGDRLKATIFLALEVTRENEDAKVIVVWDNPRNSWCNESQHSLWIGKLYNDRTIHTTYHTRACRTLFDVPERDADCRGIWTVTILGDNGNILKGADGASAIFRVRIE